MRRMIIAGFLTLFFIINVVLVVLMALLVNVNVYAKDSILEHEIRVENIIIIDLFRIREVEEFLVGIDPILKENGFKFKTNEVEGVDFSTNDPEPLMSRRFMRNAGGTVSYEYVNKFGEKLVINEYMILLQRREFESSRTISDDINMLNQIMVKLANMETVSIERIGVREKNREIGGDLKKLLKSFKLDEVNLNDVKNSANYTKTSKEIIEDIQANPKDANDMEMKSKILVKELVKGTRHTNGKDMEGYMAIAKIDVYQRDIDLGTDKNGIKLKLNELTSCIHEIRDKRLKICYDENCKIMKE